MTTPWSSETNWTVSRGSLDSAVTFESFDFPIESESTARKPPLLLVPPSSSDFEPCEIKLNFTQKHEIRQIYVRSTARVYEIYYAPALQSDNEYLCTVRCSAASVEEYEVKETVSVNSEGLNDILPKGRVASENKSGTSEDDWVEVKLPVGQGDEGNAYLPNQDYYEATAEINDSDPCMSLTLRLLSLQTKGCVYIDEVYIFADPVDSVDSENQTVNAENSASSLMTMLVPTLIGLTKSKSAQLHNQNGSNPVEKPSQTESSESKPELIRSQLTQVKDEVCDSGMRNNIPFSSNRAEILLEQLVSRVSRIEDCFLRFEENMLKPINKIEARLECVEKQVELLVKKSTFQPNTENDSQLCVESETESESEFESESESEFESESEKMESFSSGTHKPPDEVEDRDTLESSCCDEKLEENDVLDSQKKENPKKTVSIDDALAAALAGFSSFNKADDSVTPVPLESQEKECLTNYQDSIDTNVEPYSETEVTTSCDVVYREITDDIFRLEGTDEETMGPTAGFSHENNETDGQLVDQESIKEVKILTFDKTDILKYFPNETESSTVDFESPILEVKFDSLENGNFGSHIEALLSNTDDTVINEGVLINSQTNENVEIGSNLLVDFDGDDVGDEVLQQDILHVQQETCFASLI